MSIKLSEHEPTVRKNSCLSVSVVKYATRLGGTFSAGCRAALEFHRDNAKPMAAFVAAFDLWYETNDIDTLEAACQARRAVKL